MGRANSAIHSMSPRARAGVERSGNKHDVDDACTGMCMLDWEDSLHDKIFESARPDG